MTFEGILLEIGGFGKYQWLLTLCFLLPCTSLLPWVSLSDFFFPIVPEHWCYVPIIAQSNLSMGEQQRLVRPPEDPFCSMYDINYELLLKSKNYTVDTSWPRRRCNQGWDYDRQDLTETPTIKWNLVCENDYLSHISLCMIFVGIAVGTPFYGFMSDKIGRKPTFALLSSVLTMTDLFSVLCPNFAFFLVLRGLHGTCLTAIYSTIYVIVLELVPTEYRPRINGINHISFSVGTCILPFVFQATRHWRYMIIITTAISFSFLLFWKIIPESPMWLISQRKYPEATHIMNEISKRNRMKVHEGNMLFEKIQKLGEQKIVESETTVSYSFLDLVRYPIRKRFILLCICWSANNIPYYGHQINAPNLSGSPFLNFFYLAAVEIPANLGTWWLLKHMGRRYCGIIGFSIAAAPCFMPLFISHDYAYTAAALLGKAGACSTFLTVYQQAPEIFHTPIRAFGISVLSTIGSGLAFFAPVIIYLGKYSKELPYLIFAILAIFGVICEYLLPETKDKDLPQSIEDFENAKLSNLESICTSTTRLTDTRRKKSINYLTTFSRSFSLSKAVSRKNSNEIFKPRRRSFT